MDTWRLLITPPTHGPWNMAVDESILETMGSSRSLPTLRLYAWKPACLSLGYAQPLTDVDIPRLQARGWEMVRRPTGGRAVLHTDELTYSVIAPLGEPREVHGGRMAGVCSPDSCIPCPSWPVPSVILPESFMVPKNHNRTKSAIITNTNFRYNPTSF